jgi:hypothetical protein
LASLLIFFHRGSYNSNSPATFQYTSYNIMWCISYSEWFETKMYFIEISLTLL